MIADVVTHVIVSSLILAVVLAAARWIRPLTARTRHAILIAGMSSLALPAPAIANLLERSQVTTTSLFNGTLNLAPFQIPGGMKASAPQTMNILVAIWIGVAALFLLRWWMTTQRLISTAMRTAVPPSARAVRALDDVRHRLGLQRSIDLISSPTCEAPAVVRVLRPVIILPADGCETLDDEELRSLLCHECAHVARHDNLLGVAEAVVCSLFWFNPLVWLAHRRIAAAREAACDERVADAALPAETYVSALAKICRSVVAPRISAVSCMASAHLKERIEHLMIYETLRKSALSHRTIVTSAVLAVLLAVGAAGVVTADPIRTQPEQYQLNYSMNRNDAGILTVRLSVVDTTSGNVLTEPVVKTRAGEKASITFDRAEAGAQHQWLIEIEPREDGSGTITMLVTRDGRETQRTATDFPAPGPAEVRTYSGRPISLNLSNADIRDVLKTFGQLSGLQVTVATEVHGTINVKVHKMPWDQALDDIIRDAGYSYRLEGGKLHVYKP